jgi:hypothetical protein
MKKKIFMTRLLMLLLCISVLACKKTSVEPLDPEIDFKLRLLNDKGEEATVFKEGEKFSLSFLMTNKINETRFFYPDQLANSSELFRIIRTADSLDLGQPYEAILCTGLKISIKSGENLEFKVPWNSDSFSVRNFCTQNVKKNDLKKGFYKTKFVKSLSIGTLESYRITKKLDLLVSFEIN